MSEKEKAFAIFAGALVVQAIVNRVVKEQAAILGLPAKVVTAAAIVAAAALA
ncbi:hypothetical protein [Streptomyces sp. NPDC056169]|uniref:hypothetical protein n=1 Tax=Streptomyces sp. NPDC056169 TaxID=3345734 RepID=UPI0035E28405